MTTKSDANKVRAVLLCSILSSLPTLAFALSGTVFRDYDGDGARDALEPLVPGVTVSAYDRFNGFCGSTVTGGNATPPNFSFTPFTNGNCNTDYRVEFTNLPSVGVGMSTVTGVGSSVQFLPGNATNVLFGIRGGADYCVADPANTAQLRVAAARHYQTDSLLSEPTLLDFPYNNIGETSTLSHTNASIESETGALYGLAWQPSTRSLFAGAYLRRHVNDNPAGDGLGRIYRVNRNAANTGWNSGVQTYIDLEALFPGSAGTDPRPTGAYDYEADSVIWDQVGKLGLGDLHISEDDQFLYAVALADRRLYQIPATSATPVTRVEQVAAHSIPRPASCALDGDFRPFGLGGADGAIYVGAVCSGQSSATAGNTCRVNGDRSLLRGYVLRFHPGTGFDPTPMLDFALAYPRRNAVTAGPCLVDDEPAVPGVQTLGNARWNVWSGAQGDTPFQGTPAAGVAYAQPMLSEIAFERGDLVLGLRDRLTDQGAGFVNAVRSASGPAGDLLRACKQADGSFVLESNGSCSGINGTLTGAAGTASNGARGPGAGLGGEFYPMDVYLNDTSSPPISTQGTQYFGVQDEVNAGALAHVPGTGAVLSTALAAWTGLSDGGVRRYGSVSPTTAVGGYDLYAASSDFSRVPAVGDIEPLCEPAPILLGNRVWFDAVQNGRQDPLEAGVSGMSVELFNANGQLLGRSVTDGNGHYAFQLSQIFSGSDANTADADVRLPATELFGPLMYVALPINLPTVIPNSTSAGPGTAGTAELGIGDLRDSDGSNITVPNVGLRTAASVVLQPGQHKTSVDFGVLAFNDFGDLPDFTVGIGFADYQTVTASDGARHSLWSSLRLGAIVDAESDGQPSNLASNDGADEDALGAEDLSSHAGVIKPITLQLSNAQNTAARLCVFSDWDGNGEFSGPNETQFFAVPAGATSMNLGLNVPNVAPGNKYQRYRLFAAGNSCLPADANGAAIGGEVEDYLFLLTGNGSGSDFGDLPDSGPGTSGNNYQTLEIDNGPRHTLNSNLYLGTIAPDAEPDGQPSTTATGDADDEDAIADGLRFIHPDAPTILPVPLYNNTGLQARLCGFLDANFDGDFADANETLSLLINSSASLQTATLSFAPSASNTVAALRLRLMSETGVGCPSTGAVGSGEVEDYFLNLIPTRDFGDLPDSGPGVGTDNYESLLANGGAFHGASNTLLLGFNLDSEVNALLSPAGQPPRGDDFNGGDDEDGVPESVLQVPIEGGVLNVPVRVVKTTAIVATVCGFFDGNDNGSFADAADVLVKRLVEGVGTFTVNLNPTLAAGPVLDSYARIRLMPGDVTCDAAAATGGRTFGEVEDYRLLRAEIDFGDAPDVSNGSTVGNYNTRAADDGPAHRIISSMGLGATTDADSGNAQDVAAGADDAVGDDEDAVSPANLTIALNAPMSFTVAVRNSSGAPIGLCGFLDFNNNGFFDAGERQFATVNNGAVSSTLNFGTAPPTAFTSYLRLRIAARFNSVADCAPVRLEETGEVEDHRVVFGARLDYSDAQSSFGTTSHVIVEGLHLGNLAPDTEASAVPSFNADSDNLGGTNDEDGIDASLLFYGIGTRLTLPMSVTNTTSEPAGVCAYADLNGDNVFGAGEGPSYHAIASRSGAQTVWAAFGVANDGAPPLYVRARVSHDYTSAAVCDAAAPSGSGEVEDYALFIGPRDFGDLNSAALTQGGAGASHVQVSSLRIGALIDNDGNGLTSTTATGDDTSGLDDEDGVNVNTLRAAPTETAVIPVATFNSTGSAARLCTYFDGTANGSFADAGDVILHTAVGAGASVVNVALTVPGGTVPGDKFIRFRLTPSNPALPCNQAEGAGGEAAGEVEDYLFRVGPFDFGDAPDAAAGTGVGNYQTTFADGGPNHVMTGTLRLGVTRPDSDDGTLQAIDARADDVTLSPNDEDGTSTLSVLPSAGINIPVTVNNGTTGNAGVCVMLDINGNGVFENTSSERVFSVRGPGISTVNTTLGTAPSIAISTYLRLRVSSQTNPASCDTQNALDGEIEDFRFYVGNRDFGDLPQSAGGGLPSYASVAGGAAGSMSIVNGMSLGSAAIDPEAAVQGSALADGDDQAGNDDEDGLSTFTLAQTGTSTLVVTVNNNVGADLCTFVDWNRDGNFFGTNERVITNAIPANTGDIGVTLTAPASQTTGPVALRLMLFQDVGTIAGNVDCSPAANLNGGEVEDYILSVGNPDFGDAPDSYGTLLASNGARHNVSPKVAGTILRLGTVNGDTEFNGRPTTTALGDDTAGSDDEDGFTTLPTLIQGSERYTPTLTASNDSNVDAGICSYLDINGNGRFDADELIHTPIADNVANGTALVTWPLGFQELPQGVTYLRTRIGTALTTAASCSPVGALNNGEVEDYAVSVQARDFGDLPDAAAGEAPSSGGNPPDYRSRLADNGPRHTVSAALRLGERVDGDLDGVNSLSMADDTQDRVDDEAGLISITRLTPNVSMQAITATLVVTNTTGEAARACVWVDRNADGNFDDTGEIGSAPVPTGITQQQLNVIIPAPSSLPIQPSGTPGVGIRVRLAPDDSTGFNGGCDAAEANGQLTASGNPALGEVEDYYTGAPNTVPVTLVAVQSQRSGNQVQVRFATASEAGTLGFNVHAGKVVDGSRALLQPQMLIATGVGLQGGVYQTQGSVNADVDAIWIEEIDQQGLATSYGPYLIGQTSGDFEVSRTINWAPINAERRAFENARAAQRDSDADALWIRVEQDGIQAVSGADLLVEAASLLGEPWSSLKLSYQGEPVAFDIASTDALISADDQMYFFGAADTRTRYTRSAIFELAVGAGGSVMTPVNTQPMASAPDHAAARLEQRRNVLYGTEIASQDAWYAARVVRSGTTPAQHQEIFELPHYQASAGERLTVHLLGGLDLAGAEPDHAVEIVLNERSLGTELFDGLVAREIEFKVPEGLLRASGNVLSLKLPASTGYNVDRVNFEGLTLDYRRRTVVEGQLAVRPSKVAGDALFLHGFEATTNATPSVHAIALSNLGSQARFYLREASNAADGGVTRRIDGVQVQNAQASFALAFGASAHAQVFAVNSAHRPALSARPQPVDLLGETAIDLLIIADAQFAPAMAPLIAARTQEGLRVRMVHAQDIVNHFGGSYGERAFAQIIAQARSDHGLRYVLLVGGDSYDYLNYQGNGALSFIPTRYGRTGAYVNHAPLDALYGDTDSDGLIEVAIGRFPVRTLAEAEIMVAKTLAYGQAHQSQNSFAISDRVHQNYEFEAYSAQWQALLPQTWTHSALNLQRYDNTSDGLAQARAELRSKLLVGQALTTFYGHSAPAAWTRSGLLTESYLRAHPLDNLSKPTLVLQWGCWATYFVEPVTGTVAHGLLTMPGGAAALIGASALTETSSDELLANTLMPRLGEGTPRLGDALLEAQAQLQLGTPEALDVLLGTTILGDPTLRLNPR